MLPDRYTTSNERQITQADARYAQQGKLCHRPKKPIDEKLFKSLITQQVSHRAIAQALGIARSTLLRQLDKLELR